MTIKQDFEKLKNSLLGELIQNDGYPRPTVDGYCLQRVLKTFEVYEEALNKILNNSCCETEDYYACGAECKDFARVVKEKIK